MVIIGFGHRSRTGKDTSANLLAEKLRAKYPHLRIVRAAFADKLKLTCKDLFGWAGIQEAKFYDEHPEFRHTPIPELNGKTVTNIWVEVGNKLREVYQDVWVNYVLNMPCDVLIISDLRYPNEVVKIKSRTNNNLLVKLIRPDAVKLETVADNALEGNETWYDAKYVNSGSIEDLSVFVDTLVEKVSATMLN